MEVTHGFGNSHMPAAGGPKAMAEAGGRPGVPGTAVALGSLHAFCGATKDPW